ncbi:MAG: DUF748 domain-containing protein [Gammaproteobacteria bacterium]|nr:DUF748 domain-containing protein [Gammaproteobacteria bacterium]
MRRRRRRSLEVGRRVLGALFWTTVAVLSLVLALPALIPHVVPWVAARYGFDVAIERASYALPGPELRLQGLRVGAAGQALQARDVRVALDARALLAARLELSALAVEGARFTLVPVPQEQRSGSWQLFGLRPVLPAGLALPVPAALELRDVGLTFPDSAVPDLDLDFLSLAPAPAGNRLLEATARTAGGEVRVEGSLTGPGAAGGELRLRLERVDLEALAGLLSPVLPGAREGRVGGDLKAGWSSAREPVTLEGALDFVQVAADLAGSRVADATGRWEGTVRLARGGAGVTGARVVGRLSLDRGALSTSAGSFEAEGLLFEGRTGWEMSAGELGEWTLDGDGEVEHAAVREGPWAGARARQAAFWGLWRGPGREPSLGQLRAARVDLPAARGEAVRVQGLSLGEEGISLGELTAGPVTVPGPDDARPATAQSVEATEVVFTPSWSRAGMVMVTGLVAPGPQPDGGLELAGAVLQGVRVGGGEGTHLAEVQLRGLALAGVRDEGGRWRWPALPLAAGEAPTVDGVLVAPGARVSWTDLTTDPPVRIALTDVEGRLGARDRTRPGRFSARASLAEARTEVSGELGTAGGGAAASLRATLSGVPLAVLSPYLREALGWDLSAGSVSAEVDARASSAGWGGRVRLGLSGAEVVPARGSGAGTRWLARGLLLLADGQGRAAADLTFGGGARLERALSDALAASVESAYRAAGLSRAQAVQLLREGAVPLARVELDAGGEPEGAGAARLESLAALLRAHPGAHLEVCGPGPEAEVVRERLQRAGRLPATQLGTCADVPAGDQALGPPGVGLTLRSAP